MSKNAEELEREVEDLTTQVKDLRKIISNLITWVATSNNPPFSHEQASKLSDLLEDEV